MASIVGCTPIENARRTSISGTWEGAVEWTSNKVLEDRNGLTSGTFDMTFISCGKTAHVVVKETDGNTSEVPLPHLRSKGGNYIFYSLRQSSPTDPDWVETQVWSFVVAEPDALLLYWNRVVGNPKLGAGDRFRTFAQGGTAMLKRVSAKCQ